MKHTFLLLLIPFMMHGQSKIVHEIYSQYHLMPATEIVMDAFKTRDIVFIGEPHYIKEHVDFIGSLIKTLHNAGVNILFTEFARYEDTSLIDSLINGKTFNEKLARQITLNKNWYWGFREYVDIYKKAWEVNRKSKGVKFRIIGLANSKNYSVITKKEDLDDWRKRVAYNGGSEEEWAKRIFFHATDKNQKALVYCGAHHALTKYRQPYFENGRYAGLVKLGDRAGQVVFEKIKDRTAMFWFHRPLPGHIGYSSAWVNPLNGLLDSLWVVSGKKAYGFYTNSSPLGSIPDSSHVYSNGYPNFTWKEIADGCLIISPSCNLSSVHEIPDFINELNLAATNTQFFTEEFRQFNDSKEANALLLDYINYANEKLKEYKAKKCKTK